MMDIPVISSLASGLTSASTENAVQMHVLKKAMDMSAASATNLIQALPAITPSQHLPSHLGQHINTVA